MTRVLFVCGKARRRSPTAAALAAEMPGIEPDYAGLSADADERVTAEHLEWAETIVLMEKRQHARLTRLLGPAPPGKRVVCLNIPDRYDFMEPALIERLRPALKRMFG